MSFHGDLRVYHRVEPNTHLQPVGSFGHNSLRLRHEQRGPMSEQVDQQDPQVATERTCGLAVEPKGGAEW